MSTFSQTNSHALSALASCTERREVVAAGDIVCADSGTMLWAGGKPVDSRLQTKLLRRRLEKPIEVSLVVKDGLSGPGIATTARTLLEQHASLAKLTGSHSAPVLAALSSLGLQPPVQLLMTAAADRGDGTYEHAVAVCVVATSLAVRAGLPDSALATVALTGLIHDIGELYINPDYLRARRELTTQEWLHVVAHTKVGALFLEELTSHSPRMARLVRSHHERMDGTGYPEQLAGAALPREAQLLSIAETITGILTRRDNALQRASFALKLILREYDPFLVGLVTSLANPADCQLPAQFERERAIRNLAFQSRQLGLAMRLAGELARLNLAPGPRRLAERCQSLVAKLQTSLNSTGVVEYGGLAADLEADEAELLLSVDVIPAEIRWRMRSLSRDIELAERSFSQQDRDRFSALKAILTQPVPDN